MDASTTMASSSSRSQVNIRVRDLIHNILFFIFFFSFSTPSLSFRSLPSFSSSSSSSSSPPLSYPQHCNSIVPKPNPKSLHTTPNTTLHQLTTAYLNGGGAYFNGEANSTDSSSSFKSFAFTTLSVHTTDVNDVFMIHASLSFKGLGYRARARARVRPPRPRRFRTRGPKIPLRNRWLGFDLTGFWSESSGKLCMVGTGTAYSKQGDALNLSAVFKLTFPISSTIMTGLVTGGLESVDSIGSVNYFEPIRVLAFPQRTDYGYTLVSQDTAFLSEFSPGEGSDALPIENGTSLCSQLFVSTTYELEYGSGCFGTNKSCNPLLGGFAGLPEGISFREIHCSDPLRLRVLIDFSNVSHNLNKQPLVLDKTLIGEGFWDRDSNRLCLVACRFLNSTGSLSGASVGDCSVRLSMWLPGTMSIKNRSSVMGQIWSNKTMDKSGGSDKLVFRSYKNRISVVPGLKYKYTEMDRVTMFCPKKASKGKGTRYPGGYSRDMRFNMRVKNNRRVHAWGYAVPVAVGDMFYERNTPTVMEREIDFRKENDSSLLNISYSIRLTPDYYHGLTPGYNHRVSTSPGGSLNLNEPVEISAEGIYNVETGNLCMIGCRYVKLSYNHSLDCEVLVNIQFGPVDSEESDYVKGTIKSTRKSFDPLFFEVLQLSAISLTSTQAKASMWRIDFEVTMVLISNTLICIFVGLQIFYVKKHPDVLHSVSFVMLAILTLGQMIPLVLNIEASFSTNRNRQNVMIDNGGWLEVNEILVRVAIMISFMFHCGLLQLTWSSKLGNEYRKSLVLAEKKTLYVLLPLYLVGAFVAWGVQWWHHYASLEHGIVVDYKQHSLWADLRTYAGLLLDGFLFPQILFNLFWNLKDKALCPAFYMGITFVRLLPHAYDLYRAHRYVHYLDASYIYANPGGDLFSTAWDVIILCTGLLFAFFIYLQQRFGGSCILPPRFRPDVSYEKVPVINNE